MSTKKQLTIREFSRLTGIKSDNLRFYDRIGLLTPETRGDNNYRYYSHHQLNTAYMISSLRGLGVGIEDIKHFLTLRTPDKALSLFARQEARIQTEIRHLKEASYIMRVHSDMMNEALEHQENALFLQEKERELIFLCPPIPGDMDDDEGGIFSYEFAEANGVNPGFPQGTMIGRKQLELAGEALVERYYFKVSTDGNAYKPKGLYAVIYGICDPWQSEHLYLKLLDYIKKQGLSICGDAYEEYPLGDIAVQEQSLYCLRIEIPVM